VLANVLGVACSVSGKSPEQLEALIKAYPVAFFFSVAMSLVLVFDVFLPAIIFPFKLLAREAENRAMERERKESEAGEAQATEAIKKAD
jgi:hypothetical protein